MKGRIVRTEMLVGLALVGCAPTPIDAVERAGSGSSDLVAHWSFDDGGGVLARDDSKNAYHGHLVGGQWVQAGRFSGALHLNYGDYVAVDGFQNASPNWTVSAWFSRAQGEDIGPWSALLSNGILGTGGWLLFIEPTAATVPAFSFEYDMTGDPGLEVFACCTSRPGVWYHLTVVVADRTATLYVGTEARASGPMTSTLLPGNPTLYIGKGIESDVNAQGGLFNGTIDDISIFSRALTADEIARIDSSPSSSLR